MLPRAAENHVFHEVGESPLIVALLERTGANQKAECYPPTRLSVAQDDGAKTVGQRTKMHCGIENEVADNLRPTVWLRRCERQKRNKTENDREERAGHHGKIFEQPRVSRRKA
jgi:hypothetical protein